MSVKLFCGIILYIIASNSLFAETYVREYTHNASKIDNKYTSRVIALDQIKILLLQEIGTYIHQEINVTKDGADNTYASENVKAVTAGLTKVIIIEEKWDGVAYYLKAKIETDPKRVLDALAEYKKSNSEKNRLQLKALKSNERALQKSREEITRLVKELESTESERQTENIFVKYLAGVNQLSAGDMYVKGYDYHQQNQYEMAYKWFLKAAELGYVEGQYAIGFMYYNAQGVEQDIRKAFDWYKKAANQGHADAQLKLAIMYDKEGNYSQSIAWYKKAAEQGEPTAQFLLGLEYRSGKVVEKSLSEAIKWYRKSADQRYIEAQNGLGFMYYHGEGVEQDFQQAINWYRKAAEQGGDGAQYSLGLMYASGKGVSQDIQQSVMWVRKAAEQNNAEALFYLGALYYRGKNVSQDKKKATELFRKACDAGKEKSCSIFSKLNNQGY